MQSELERQQKHDAIWDSVGKLLRAASAGTITWEEAYQDYKRYRIKADECRLEEKQETQQRMFDLAMKVFGGGDREK